jgi:uncharacterized YccA/Bax inhibitor family protein
MPNPVLNDKSFREASRAGWAAPDSATQYNPGISDGPVSSHGLMTMSGTVTATGALFAILLATAAFGWNTVKETEGVSTGFPSWILFAILGGFGLTMLLRFKPKMAPVLAPLYAAIEGVVVGSISHVYNVAYKGVVVQAIGATLGVFAIMLFLYKTRIIKVTDRMRRAVGAATMGLMLFYLVSIVLNLVHVNVPFINSASPVGILFSVFAAGLASWHLAIDFDNVERYVAAGSPKYMEWYAGFGLMVTVVWLYLELLRLFAKLQRR